MMSRDVILCQDFFFSVSFPCLSSRLKHLVLNSGVYSVDINTEHQVVMVSGCVDSATLIKKLVKSGKPAELWSPSFGHKLNQEQASMNQMQHMANDLMSPKNQHIFPVSFGNEIEDMGSFENYLNQNIGMKAVNARTDLDLIAATRMGNAHLDEDKFSDHGRLEDDMALMMGRADYQGNDTGFVGLEGHEFNGVPTYQQNHLPPMMMTNRQQGFHYSYPARKMNNIYMQDMQNSNNMINDIYMRQPHMINHVSSVCPPCTDYNFNAALHSYY